MKTRRRLSDDCGPCVLETPLSVESDCLNISSADLYFEVKVNVSITGDSHTEEVLCFWVNSSLPDDVMILLDLHLLPKPLRDLHDPEFDQLAADVVSGQMVSSEHSDAGGFSAVGRMSCVFQIRVTASLTDPEEMEAQIRDLLLLPYDNGSVSIATEDIHIIRIFVVNCRPETVLTKKGVFRWPVTAGGQNATHHCPENPDDYGTRHCKLSPTSQWWSPDLDRCSLWVETITDLDLVQVTAENGLDVVAMIQGLLSNQSSLNYNELATVLEKLGDVVNSSVVTPDMGQALIDVISVIMQSVSDLLPFTNMILNIMEAVGNTMVDYQSSYTLVAPAIAVSVVNVVPGQFDTLTFSVSSDSTGMKPEVFINSWPLNGTVAFISLPTSTSTSKPSRVIFQFYGLPMLLFQSSNKKQVLNTFVVSASVTTGSSPTRDLSEDVQIMLHHLLPNTQQRNVQCVYWNFNENDGRGGWDGRGCRAFNSTSGYTTCVCDHLTHFGVLLDVSRTPVDPANEQILTIITYIGCGVSSLFLGITVLTYTAFEKLRRDYPSQILLNLSLALLGLNLVFLVNSWLSSWGVWGLCAAVAAALHYFLLASFTWMGLEAVHMYFALVKVFNVYVPSYILKFCVVGWGVPLLICCLVFMVNSQAYGSSLDFGDPSAPDTLDNSGNFCWIQDNATFFVSVVAYAVLIFFFNVAVFVVVLIQIRRMRANSPAGSRSGLVQELKGMASLTLLLGLTWTFGFFTWGPARVFLLYLFSGLNSLQGLFIFLFHCLMKESVRRQWRVHLCFGPFQLDDSSERSHSASAGGVAKPGFNPQRLSAPSVHSAHSSSTDSTSASSEREASYRRPNLALLVNSLALPRAHSSSSSSSSAAAAKPSHRGAQQTPGWKNHLIGQQEHR
ncbi:adhesion G-protein coupled receptor G4-like [Nelusetta ayraudi]|uniref:adhesion G-protein coupled receptor G4-like n=1 Tax=Nelusetta ayraudi TaxID=303726 RepID=UPI003F7150C5